MYKAMDFKIWEPSSQMTTTKLKDTEDDETRTYLAEMRNQMTARVREEQWEETQQKIEALKDTHYRKWRRVCFISK